MRWLKGALASVHVSRTFCNDLVRSRPINHYPIRVQEFLGIPDSVVVLHENLGGQYDNDTFLGSL